MVTKQQQQQRSTSAKRSTHHDGRAKAASIFLREERKSDKRQVLADALVAKLRAKYAKNDPEFAETIEQMTVRLIVHTQRRIVESDIVALEAVVRKMSSERAAKRGPARPSANAGTPSGGASSFSSGPGVQEINRSGANGNRGVPPELKGQDEWVLLNALTLVEYEHDCDAAKRKQTEKQQTQRAWLDQQRAEKISRSSIEKQQQHRHYERQVDDLNKWQSEESVKKQRQQEQIFKVRIERDEQLRQQKLKQEQEAATRRRDEENDLQRVHRELQKMEENAALRRQLEHERVKRLQEENAREQAAKSQLKKKEQEDDVKLMEAYARRLAKEEEDRMNALQTKLKRRDKIANGITSTLQAEQRKRELEGEKRAEEYQRKKDEAAIKKEQETAERRRREALERKQFLELQRRQKQEREHQEVEDDMTYAQYVHQDSRASIEEAKRHKQQVRQRNEKEQARLLEQMQEQKEGKPLSPIHLPRTLMNSREKHLNAKLLQKLEQPEVAQQVLKKLSPTKDQNIAISTSFY